MSHPYITKSNADLRYNQMLETAENHRRAKRAQHNSGRLIPVLASFLGRLVTRSPKQKETASGEAVPA